MNIKKHIRAYLIVCSLVAVLQPLQGRAQQNSDASKTSAQHAPPQRDGQHDFDFELGTWQIHLKKLLHPLAGSTTWVEFDGTSVTRKVWGGRADLEEFETDNPVGGRIEGLTLRLYNPQTHQWSLYWGTSKSGALGPPTIGEFKDGRGEFYDTEPSGPNGRSILVRFIWSKTDTDTPHFEQSFSDDGGKTWEVNWITDQTRKSDEADNAPAPQSSEAMKSDSQQAASDGQRDFDFLFGTWNVHLKTLLHPLTGSTTWVEFEGTSVARKVWNGRANLNEFEADRPSGHIEGLTLRLYDPKTHQWSLYWATSKGGRPDVPTVGEFKNGRGEFFDTEASGPNGRAILVRYVWSDMTPNSVHFEQAFSDDGGKTWEVNWISDQTRVKDASDKADLDIEQASFGKKLGQAGFDRRADVKADGIVNVLDFNIVASQILSD